jgi:hypothetical protein
MIGLKVGNLDIEITEDDLRAAQAAADVHWRQLRHPYIFDLIKVLAPRQKLKRTIALDWIYKSRTELGLPIPRTFNNTVQSSFQYYCSEASAFMKRNGPSSEALFYFADGKGEGVWAVNLENARAWVVENRAALKRRVLGPDAH